MDSNHEHWLTIWECNICQQIPESAPLHRCKLGHIYCNSCYTSNDNKSGHDGERFTCVMCGSEDFDKYFPSSGFLKKLKVKPGIGRPYRYSNVIQRTQSLSEKLLQQQHRREEMVGGGDDGDAVTVEKLFRLPSDKLRQLFLESNRRQFRQGTSKQTRNIGEAFGGRDASSRSNCRASSNSVWLARSNSKILAKSTASTTSLQSKKPLVCPHDPCRKVVAISSFHEHFKHEHPQIERYSIERGKELLIDCDISTIEHNLTFCLAMISVYEIACPERSPTRNNQKIHVNTFWLMVSGSPDERHSTAYALYWLFSDRDDSYRCTFDMVSADSATCCSAHCAVNCIHDSQEIPEVAQRLNCLYLSRGSLISLLEAGPLLKLGIIVH